MSDDPSRRIRVLLADDEALIRAGLRLVLVHADDIEVIAETDNGAAAVDLAVRHRPDVVLMDIRMPGMDGLTATEQLASRAPLTQVVILTTFGEDEYIARALTAGAAGFILKDTEPYDLLYAIRAAADGHAILSPRITRNIITQYVISNATRVTEARRIVTKLTDRERDVLVLVGHGLSNAEVGRQLHMGEGTVKTHVRHILTKLDRTNRVQAAIIAHEAGLVPTT